MPAAASRQSTTPRCRRSCAGTAACAERRSGQGPSGHAQLPQGSIAARARPGLRSGMNLASPVTADGRLGTRVACLLAGGALLLALAVLAGWLFNVVALTSILPGLVSMKPMSALLL